MSLVKNIRKKWDRIPLAAKASIALVFAKFFEKGIAMISAPIFTRIMNTSQYGTTSTFTAWQSILFIVVTLNLASGVFNNGMMDFEDDRDSFIFSLMCTSFGVTSIFAIIYFLFQNKIQEMLGLSHTLIIFMFIYFYISPNYGFWANRQRYELKYKALTIVTILSSLLSLGVSILVVLKFPDSMKAIGKVIGSESGLLIISIFFILYNAIRAKFRAKLEYMIYAVKFNIQLVPHYLSVFILSSSDRIMITEICGESDTAVYSVAYTVATIMLIFWSAVESSFVPWLYNEITQNNINNIRKNINYLVSGFAVVCLLSACFAPEIIKILATKEYYKGIYVVPSVVASVYFTAIYSIYMRIELYYKNTKVSMVATSISAVCNILLNMIFIPKFGFVAAGYTTLACYILQALTHYVAVKRMKKSYFYDTKYIFILSGIIIVVSIVILSLYSNDILRYTIIALILLLFIIFRKKVIELFKKLKN